MRKVVRSQTLANHKRETTMVIYVLSTAPPFAPKTRYFAKDQKVNQVVKNPIHVTILTQKPKETILVVYVLAIVPKTVKPMKFYALAKKIVMDVIQKKSVDQRLKIKTESFALMILLPTPVLFNATRPWEPSHAQHTKILLAANPGQSVLLAQELLTGISVLAIQFVRSNANGTKFCATMVLILGDARTLTCVFHEEKTMTETCALNNALHNALKMSFSALAHFYQTDAKEKQVA